MPADGWDTLGFAPAWTCEVNPEFPGTGDWGCPHYGFHADGATTEPFRSPWGPPLIVRFHPADADQWVGSFAASGLAGTTGVFACPAPTHALVVCEGQPYLVDLTTPSQTTPLEPLPVTQVCRVHDLDQLLLVSGSDLTALGPAGLAWRSERLCLDNLRVHDAAEDGIHCSGDFVAARKEFTVDPRSGQVRSGPRFLDSWPHP